MAKTEIENRIITIITRFFNTWGIDVNRGILLCLSGGIDSTALMYSFILYKKHAHIDFPLHGLHVNHRLRPENETDRDWNILQKAAELCSVPVERAELPEGAVTDLSEKKRCGIEAAARELRYAEIETCRIRHELGYAAFGHNADDLAETMIARFFQGCGISGLHGIPAVGSAIIRPLLEVRKNELSALIEVSGLPCSFDSSNDDDDFQRNRIRRYIMPVLEQEFPSVVKSLSQSSSFFLEEDALLAESAHKIIHWSIEENCATVELASFFALPETMRIRSLLGIINRLKPEAKRVPRKFLASIQVHENDNAEKILLSGYGFTLIKQGRNMVFLPSVVLKAKTRYVLRVHWNRNLIFRGFTLRWRTSSGGGEKMKSSMFLAETIMGKPILCRSRRSGDQLLTTGGLKRLKAVFSAMKVPENLRDMIPVIQIGGAVAGLFGSVYGYTDVIDERFRENKKTEPGLLLTVHNGE